MLTTAPATELREIRSGDAALDDLLSVLPGGTLRGAITRAQP